MPRLPHEYWLKYLLISARATTQEIEALCELCQLEKPTTRYLSQLRFELEGKSSCTDQTWLRKHKIKALACGDPSATKARELLTTHRLRPKIEALLICGMPDKDVSFYLGALTEREVPISVVAMYRHYFWNVDLLSLADWYAFLETYQNGYGKRLRSYLNQGVEHTLWKLGYTGTVDSEVAIRGILYESSMRFKELGSYANGQNTAMAAKMWAENIFKAAELLNRNEDVLKSTMDELSKHAIRLGKREISSLQTLPLDTKEVPTDGTVKSNV